MEGREEVERKEEQPRQGFFFFFFFFDPKSMCRVYGWTSRSHCITYSTPQIFRKIRAYVCFPRVQIHIVLFFLTSLLEYNCFIMLCQFLLYSKVNQLYVYIYPISHPSCISLPPFLSHTSKWSQQIHIVFITFSREIPEL